MTNYYFTTGHKDLLKAGADSRRYLATHGRHWLRRQFTPYCAPKPKRFSVKFKDPSREIYLALCLSTDKWWRVAFGGRISQGCSDCALCKLVGGPRVECYGCPINDITGGLSCAGTCHALYADSAYSYGSKSSPTKTAARRFYYWLQDLRDEYRDQLEQVEKGG